MKRIFVGTTNPAKLRQLGSALALAGVEVASVGDRVALPDVVEDRLDASGNARKKARAFAAAAGVPVLAVDAALFFPGLPERLQPGVFVRRIAGRAGFVPDDDVLAYYEDLCRAHGGVVEALWNIGVAVAAPDGSCEDDVIEVRRKLVAPATSARREGFPLDSLQVDPLTGRYLAEFTDDEEEALWQRTIGVPLSRFVADLGDAQAPGTVSVPRSTR